MEQDSNTVIDFTKIKLFSLETIMPLPLFSMMNDFLVILAFVFPFFFFYVFVDNLLRHALSSTCYNK